MSQDMAAQRARGRRQTGHGLAFVGGAPRSGTTLLQNMLDSHPHVLGLPEFIALPEIMEVRDYLHDLVDREWIDRICTHQDIDASVARLIRELLLARVPEDPAIRLVTEKTPEDIFVFEALQAVLPEARFVVVVRDPRAVVASLLKVRRRFLAMGRMPAPRTRTLRAATTSTTDALDSAGRARRAASDRILAVRYEDLVREPERETRRVVEFLGLSWSGDMTTPSRFDHPGEKAITLSGAWYDAASFNQDPDPSRADRWRSTMSPLTQAVVATHVTRHVDPGPAADLLADYDLSPGAYGRLRVALARLVVTWWVLADRLEGLTDYLRPSTVLLWLRARWARRRGGGPGGDA